MLIRLQRGLTMLELMIGLGIVAFLMAVGAPSFSKFMLTAKNRTAAESVMNGVTMARKEAIFRQKVVRFDLTSDGSTVSWKVGCVVVTTDCPAVIEERAAVDSDGKVRVGISTDDLPTPIPAGHFAAALAQGAGMPAGISFNGLGRVPTANKGDDLVRVDLLTDANAKTQGRRYVVTVLTGGAIRMCDPTLANGSPQGC